MKLETIEEKLRAKARQDYSRRVDEAWVLFCKTVRVRQGIYVKALHETGKLLTSDLMTELGPEIEQQAVDEFLKKFEEFGEQLRQLENAAHEH